MWDALEFVHVLGGIVVFFILTRIFLESSIRFWHFDSEIHVTSAFFALLSWELFNQIALVYHAIRHAKLCKNHINLKKTKFWPNIESKFNIFSDFYTTVKLLLGQGAQSMSVSSSNLVAIWLPVTHLYPNFKIVVPWFVELLLDSVRFRAKLFENATLICSRFRFTKCKFRSWKTVAWGGIKTICSLRISLNNVFSPTFLYLWCQVR